MAGGIETLTQRYWEAMLSRMVIVGHCPKKLEDLVGYNPVVEMDNGYGGWANVYRSYVSCSAELAIRNQIVDIIEHMEDSKN